ncbi:MAG: hypothetical protein J3Q66DRAFT_323777 [Benniella sp.]|nr:MAG: hypothetical protein J3Q66DRAFT_323777 [Benniella sp.]
MVHRKLSIALCLNFLPHPSTRLLQFGSAPANLTKSERTPCLHFRLPCLPPPFRSHTSFHPLLLSYLHLHCAHQELLDRLLFFFPVLIYPALCPSLPPRLCSPSSRTYPRTRPFGQRKGTASMFQVDNFISFHDLTPEACFLWASSSITACLGYDPDEVVGMKAYNIIHKDDIEHVKLTHQESVLNEMVGTQLLLRIKAKNDSYVPCMVIFSLCYDYIVSCYTVVEQSVSTMRKVSAHSAAMTSLVGSREMEFERIHRHHQAFRENTWNANSLDLEPRICMLLNRFTRNLVVLYASPSCEIILNVDPEMIVGKPFLLFIRSDDLATFVEQADRAKATTVVTHMRFYFQSPNYLEEVPCEAMLFGAADAMIAIMRRCKPFIRTKPMITAAPTTDYQACESSISTSYNSNSSYQANSYSRTFHRGNRHLQAPGYSSRTSACSSSTYPSSPPDSTASSFSSSASFSSASNRQGNRSYKAPLRGITMGSINSIRNLDSDQTRLRPLKSLHIDESDIVDADTPLPEIYRLRSHHVEDPDADATLEQKIREMNLEDEYLELDEDDEFEDDEVMDESGMPSTYRSDGYSIDDNVHYDSSRRER